MDSRFYYGDTPTWRHGTRQGLQGTELISIPATNKSPLVYEYDFPSNSILLFGPLSGFLVKGAFQVKKKDAADFESIEEAEATKIALQPNWFEHLIKDIRVFHGNTAINTHDVPRGADPFLNTYIYAHMYKDTKKHLFPESEHPGHCVGRVDSDWALNSDTSVWRKYSKKVFGDKIVSFRYVPTFLFPFYQQPNFCVDGRPPGALYMPLVQKMTISLQFKDSTSHIFMKPAADENTYRFKIENISLVVEEARMNPLIEKKLLNEKKTILYAGLSRYGVSENVAANAPDHRVRFQNVPMPEGIFIFALDKNAPGGTYQCGVPTSKVFAKHNIKSVNIKYGNYDLNLKSPKLGDVREHVIEIKQYLDHFAFAPFGVLQDPDKISFDLIKEGGDETVFPHLYINLTPSGNQTRVVPINDGGSVLQKTEDLDLFLKFSHNGATADVAYIIYIFYTDVAVAFDMKTKTFTTIYSKV